jgi:hypothetical protein
MLEEIFRHLGMESAKKVFEDLTWRDVLVLVPLVAFAMFLDLFMPFVLAFLIMIGVIALYYAIRIARM